MKSIVRRIIFYSVSLFLTSQIIFGLKISGGFSGYLIGGIILSILFLVIRPILKIITLPLSIITLGWFSFIINAIILYLLTILDTNISLSAFTFNGIDFVGFIVPKFYVNSFFAFIMGSVILSAILRALKWLTEK